MIKRFLILFVLSTSTFSQVYEKDGFFYKDIPVSKDTHNVIPGQSTTLKTNGDPKELPTIKSDFIINEITGIGGSEQYSLSIAKAGTGNYCAAWIDFRNGNKQIFVQFYDADGNKIGDNKPISYPNLNWNNSPFVAANDNGDFLITFAETYYTILVYKFNSAGTQIGSQTINTTGIYSDLGYPSAILNNDQSFLIMFTGTSSGQGSDLIARRYDSSGLQAGSDIVVNDPDNKVSSFGETKNISKDNSGNYCITWSSYGGTPNSKIYLQLLNSMGQRIGQNQIVSTSASTEHKYFSKITSTSDGNFLIAWYLDGGGISARIFNSLNYFVTDVIELVEPEGMGNTLEISSDRDSTFFVLLYLDDSLRIKRINKYGSDIGTPIAINGNLSLSSSYYKSMTEVINNSFLFGYLEYNGNNSEVYYHEFSYNISPQSEPVKINDDWGSSNQYKPQVKFNSFGESIIVWYDQRNGRDELYAQLYDAEFNPINSNICLSDTPIYWSTGLFKDIVALSDGTFIIVWLGSDDGYPINLAGQKISRTGEKIGGNKMLEQPLSEYTRINLGINNQDEIGICWYDSYRIKYKIIDRDLNTLRNEITLLSINYPISFGTVDTYIESDLSLLVALQYYNSSTYERDKNLHTVHFDSRGKIKSALVIDSLAGHITELDCRKDGWDIAVLYKENSNTQLKRIYLSKDGKTIYSSFGYTVYNALHPNILEFKDANILLVYNGINNLYGFYANDNKRKTLDFTVQQNINSMVSQYEYEYDYGISYFNNKMFLAYQSNSNGDTGIDIWANVKKIDDLDFSKSFFYPEQKEDFLYDNFPNPFNPATTIAYELLAFHKVKLTVYDILGREVKTLVNEYQEKGVYEVKFDASELASGVYFYKLEAFDTTIKKMLLIK